MAYEGERSWWCGNFDYDMDGGYGNGWDDRLELPPIYVNPVPVEDVSWAVLKALYRDGTSGDRKGRGRDPVMPVLTFAYRHDSEIGYDFTYVQAESSGAYVNLNRGYDGVQPWTDVATTACSPGPTSVPTGSSSQTTMSRCRCGSDLSPTEPGLMRMDCTCL
jgi:hypothetical protein